MTGETQREPSGWTPDTLKVLEDEKIDALARLFGAEITRLDAALKAQQREHDKFEDTVERAGEKQNEFRGSLEDLGKTMATRRELETGLLALTARLDEQARQVSDLRSRLDIGPAQLPGILSQQNQQLGRQEGIRVTTTAFYSALAATGIVAGIVGHFVK